MKIDSEGPLSLSMKAFKSKIDTSPNSSIWCCGKDKYIGSWNSAKAKSWIFFLQTKEFSLRIFWTKKPVTAWVEAKLKASIKNEGGREVFTKETERTIKTASYKFEPVTQSSSSYYIRSLAIPAWKSLQ